MRRFTFALFVLSAINACGSSSTTTGVDDLSGPAPSPSASAAPVGPSGVLSDAGAGDAPAPAAGPTLLYAHTDTTLFKLDPNDIAAPMQRIGDFDCIDPGSGMAMTDLGVTKDGKLYGVSQGQAYPLEIQGSTVHCVATWSLPQTRFYGLTVAPANTLGPAEVLVAADGNGGLWRIDATSGTPTQVGSLGTDPVSGKPWSLSGDIVFLENGGAPVGFATVRTCSSGGGCSSTDTLIEVDVKAIKPGTQSVLKAVRGAVVKGAWCTNASSPATFGSMYGIVAYQDKVYGFSRSGNIVEIHNTDGTACLISANPANKFAGAGVTTSAPVVAPPAVN